ncbi:DUF421 domain-containing protein [Bacillus salitolerans]|uniref:DUF421 domain-containing protein n=1 Tax=Bacillus salitolerans TaxID=1437434 RepID=A0ABW4LTU1_9BACI
MNHYLSIALEITIGLGLLFIVTKVQGKTQFSQITPFDFISALILGELLGNAIYDHEVKITEILFAVTLWGVLIYFIEFLTQKFKGSRKILEGEPNIVIHKGQIKYNALKKARLDINQLQSLIRQQGYFSFQEVEFAIIETNGLVSVLPKPAFDTPKNQDLNVPLSSVSLPINLILDGEVVQKNLKEVGFDEQWLKSELEQQDISDYRDVLFAEWVQDKPLFVLKYESATS